MPIVSDAYTTTTRAELYSKSPTAGFRVSGVGYVEPHRVQGDSRARGLHEVKGLGLRVTQVSSL